MKSRLDHRLVEPFDVALVPLEISQVRLPRLIDQLVEVELRSLALAAATSRHSRGRGTKGGGVLLLLQVVQLKSSALLRREAEQDFMPGGDLGHRIIPLVLGAVVAGMDGVHVSPEGEL